MSAPMSAPVEKKMKGKRAKPNSGCKRCKERKTKCDTARPVCSHCEKDRAECVYPNPAKTSSDNDKIDVVKLTPVQGAMVQWQKEEDGQMSFYSSAARIDFSNLKVMLTEYHNIPVLKESYMWRIPVYVLIALSMNDYTSSQNLRGRMRHTWGHETTWRDVIYFAYRDWAETEAQEWKGYSPHHRAHMSTVFQPWHWTEYCTRVLPIRVFSDRAKTSTDIRFRFHLAGEDLESARKQCTGAVLFCIENRVWFMSMKEWLSSATSRSAGPRIKRYGKKKRQKEGTVLIDWTFSESGSGCREWLQQRELLGDQLEVALHDKMVSMITDEVDDTLNTNWGSEYDRLIPANGEPVPAEASIET